MEVNSRHDIKLLRCLYRLCDSSALWWRVRVGWKTRVKPTKPVRGPKKANHQRQRLIYSRIDLFPVTLYKYICILLFYFMHVCASVIVKCWGSLADMQESLSWVKFVYQLISSGLDIIVNVTMTRESNTLASRTLNVLSDIAYN